MENEISTKSPKTLKSTIEIQTTIKSRVWKGLKNPSILIKIWSRREKYQNMSNSLILRKRIISEVTMFILVKEIFKAISPKITNFTITSMTKRSILKIEYFEKMFIFTIIEKIDNSLVCKVEKVTILIDRVLNLLLIILADRLKLIILSKNISIFPQIQVF